MANYVRNKLNWRIRCEQQSVLPMPKTIAMLQIMRILRQILFPKIKEWSLDHILF